MDLYSYPTQESVSNNKAIRSRQISSKAIRLMMNAMVGAAFLLGMSTPLSAQDQSEVIYDVNGGQSVTLNRQCDGYTLYFGVQLLGVHDGGIAQRLIFDGDDVYMYNPVSQFHSNSYIKGSVEENGNLVFTFPQCLQKEIAEGETTETAYFVNRMVLTETTTGSNWYEVVDDPSLNKIVFELDADGNYTMESKYEAVSSDTTREYPALLMGVTDSDGYWQKYGDYENVLTPFSTTVTNLPEGLTSTPYALISGVEGIFVDYASDGENFYLKGFLNNSEQGWAKGSIKDGKVVFPSGQYLGIQSRSSDYFAYFLGSRIEEQWDEARQKYVNVTVLMDELTLTPDFENKTLTADNNILIAGGIDYDTKISNYVNPVLKWQPEEIDKTPQAPDIIYIQDYSPMLGEGFFEYVIPSLNVDGQLLDSSNLEYSMLVDNERFIFDEESYPFFPSGMQWIPYKYTDNWMILNMTDYQILFFTFSGAETIGLQSRYKDENGEWFSEITTVPTSGVKTLSEETEEPINVEYYNLMGTRLNSAPESGLYIKVSKYADGTSRSVKEIKR